jgi:ABC-type amino acid transport substrate-binding protein
MTRVRPTTTNRLAAVKSSAVALLVLVIAASCGSPPATTAGSTASTPAVSGDALAQLRARGSITVVIRVGASPGGQQIDVAHSQKRALESSIATELAKRVLGPQAKVEFVELGRDRWSPVEQRTADIAMISASETPSPNVILTPPYAAGGVVIAVKRDSKATEARALAGQTIGATTMGELNAAELAQAYLKDNGFAATVAPFPGLVQAVAALDSGQVVAVVGDNTGLELLQRGRAEPLRVLARVASRPYVIAVRSDAVAIHAAFSAALKDLLASGEVQRMATAAAFPYELP